MGMFDTILVYMECPYCGLRVNIDCQTKDLTKSMFVYRAMHRGYLAGDKSNEFFNDDRERRKRLSVSPEFPHDKSHVVWKNQLEHIRCSAKLPAKFKDLNSISVFCECPSHKCNTYQEKKEGKNWSGLSRTFSARLKVVKGFILDEMIDFKLKEEYKNGKKERSTKRQL